MNLLRSPLVFQKQNQRLTTTTRASTTTTTTTIRLLRICFVASIIATALTSCLGHSSSDKNISKNSYKEAQSTKTTCTGATSSKAKNSRSLSSSYSSATAFQPPLTSIMRAWHCHGRNQRELVERLQQAGIVRSPQVRDVLNQVDRQNYVTLLQDPQQQQQQQQQQQPPVSPYMDAPQAIGLGQTISAPHMHAHVLEEMLPYLVEQKEKLQLQQQQPQRSLRVLDVGCGSGYLTACLGRWFQPRPVKRSSDTTSGANGDTPAAITTDSSSRSIMGFPGRVFGIDIYPHLVNLTKDNISKNDDDLLQTGMITLKVANGWKGLSEHAPFDAIHVGAAAADFPTELALQLRVGGVLIVPVGPVGGVQNLYKVERVANDSGGGEGEYNGTTPTHRKKFVQTDFKVKELLGVRYVPLVQQPGVDEL